MLLGAGKLGKPVKWTETRSESLLTAHHGRDQIQDITIAADRDGTVPAWTWTCSPTWAPTSRWSRRACRSSARSCTTRSTRSRRYQFSCTGVFTTKTPTDAYRGAGRPEATFAIERIVDELAAELGMEPLELREQNWITHEEFPFTTMAGLTYDTGNYEAATAKATELFGYDELRREQQERRESRRPGAARHRHLDLHRDVRARARRGCSARWPTARAAGRPRRSGCCRPARSRWSPARRAHGQGHETAWSQIVADQLGVPFEDIEVLHGDTQVSPQGHGHLRLAVAGRRRDRRGQRPREKVVDKARPIAAHLLEASEDDLEFTGGRFAVKGTDKGVTIQELAFATFAAHDLPDGRGALARRRRHLRPGRTSPSRTAPTCARWRSTPRPGRRTIRASTSASTTSAT